MGGFREEFKIENSPLIEGTELYFGGNVQSLKGFGRILPGTPPSLYGELRVFLGLENYFEGRRGESEHLIFRLDLAFRAAQRRHSLTRSGKKTVTAYGRCQCLPDTKRILGKTRDIFSP